MILIIPPYVLETLLPLLHAKEKQEKEKKERPNPARQPLVTASGTSVREADGSCFALAIEVYILDNSRLALPKDTRVP